MVTVDVEHHVYFLTYFVKCCAEDAETSDTYCVIEVLSKITTLLCLAVSFYFRPVSFYFRPVSRPFSLGLDRAYRLAWRKRARENPNNHQLTHQPAKPYRYPLHTHTHTHTHGVCHALVVVRRGGRKGGGGGEMRPRQTENRRDRGETEKIARAKQTTLAGDSHGK